MKTYAVLLFVLVLVWACTGSANEEAATQDEPQGMVMAEVSELALLMKNIHADAKNWRSTLLDGSMVEADPEIYEALVQSTPTNANVQGPAFEGFSAHYQSKLDAFLEAGNIDLAISEYNNLVSACVQCHQSYCTGPIPTIKKLYISEQ